MIVDDEPFQIYFFKDKLEEFLSTYHSKFSKDTIRFEIFTEDSA